VNVKKLVAARFLDIHRIIAIVIVILIKRDVNALTQIIKLVSIGLHGRKIGIVFGQENEEYL